MNPLSKYYFVAIIVLIIYNAHNIHAQIPEFNWAGAFGGSSSQYGVSIKTDNEGNVYTTGRFSGTVDFDPGPGTYNLTTSFGNDIFISKLNSNGQFVWAVQIGSTGSEQLGWSIDIDDNGNILTTGQFAGTVDFDPGSGTYFLTSEGSNPSVFISKLDSDANFLWAQQIGASSSEIGVGISVDNENNILLTGGFNGVADFDPGPGIFNMSTAGGYDIFICKLDSNGNFNWAKSIGGVLGDFPTSMTHDSSNNVYITGHFQDKVDFNPGSGSYQLSSFGDYDSFVLKLDNLGNLIWAKQLGGIDEDRGKGISVDLMGNVYTTGVFFETADFDPGPNTFNLTSLGSGNVFISKLDSLGNFIWAKRVGGATVEWDEGNSIVADINSNIYITGRFHGTVDFDPNSGINNISTNGFDDIFILKLNSEGNFVWATGLGGPETDMGFSITLDPAYNVITTGFFEGDVDFDPSSNNYFIQSLGSVDVFVLKYGMEPLGILENDIVQDLIIYPNPSNGVFNVRLNDDKLITSIRIMNTLGQLIISNTYPGNKQVDFRIEVNSGVYLIEAIRSDGSRSFSKFIMN